MLHRALETRQISGSFQVPTIPSATHASTEKAFLWGKNMNLWPPPKLASENIQEAPEALPSPTDTAPQHSVLWPYAKFSLATNTMLPHAHAVLVSSVYFGISSPAAPQNTRCSPATQLQVGNVPVHGIPFRISLADKCSHLSNSPYQEGKTKKKKTNVLFPHIIGSVTGKKALSHWKTT